MKNLTRFAAVIAFSAIAFLFTAVNPVCAATFTVNATSDITDGNPGDGICETGLGNCSVRAAVQEANALASSDTINFAASLSGATITLTVVNGGEIQILDNGSLIINGLGANVLTIDGGEGTNRIFHIRNARTTIRGVTLQGGNGTGTINSGSGGAIYANFAIVELDAIQVRNNSAQFGGGLYMSDAVGTRIINSTFTNNSAANDGGGICNFNGSTFIANTTISGNSAVNNGGGLFNNGSVGIRNSTVTLNTSASGGGIYNIDPFNIGNTIVAGNTASFGPEILRTSGFDQFSSAGNNLIGDSAGDSTNTGNSITYQASDIRDVPPQLGALANYGGPTPTHSLLVSSPAINVGKNALAVDPFDNTPLLFDQRGTGFPRIINTTVDIGAYESNSDGFVVNTVADTNDASAGNGTCADSLGTCSLRAAIQESNALAGNQTINFSPGLLGLTIMLDPAKGSLNITTNTVINGLGSGSIFVSGGDAVRVFNITGGTININRLTALNGNADSLLDGGGIYSNGSALTLENVIVRNSTATYGGGVYVRGGSLNMTTSSVSGNNTTNDGGGILLVNVLLANITNSNIVSNNAVDNSSDEILGGGIFSVDSNVILSGVSIINNRVNNNGSGSTLGGGMAVFGGGFMTTMINCTFSGNRTKTQGGGANFQGGTYRVSGTTFSGNIAGDNAGGLTISFATATLVNSTVSGNTAVIGGGIGSFGAHNTTLRNVTVAGNTATFGGGISNQDSPITLANTIVADNTATTNSDVDGGINSLGNNLVRNRTGSGGYVASDLPNGTNPLLGALQNNGGATLTRALLAGSPAIDAGNNAQALNTDNTTPLLFDQRGTGFPRLVDGNSDGIATVDIGAFEVQLAPTAASVTVGGRVTTSDGRGIRNAFVTITNANGVSRTALTGKFGAYRFTDVAAGETYIISVRAKRFTFGQPTQVRTITEDLTDVDFAANEQSSTTFD